MKVWKYTLDAPDAGVAIPRGARFLTAAMQGSDPVVWALVDPEAPKTTIRLLAAVTGQPLPPGVEYIGTVTSGAGVVWHIFWEPA